MGVEEGGWAVLGPGGALLLGFHVPYLKGAFSQADSRGLEQACGEEPL